MKRLVGSLVLTVVVLGSMYFGISAQCSRLESERELKKSQTQTSTTNFAAVTTNNKGESKLTTEAEKKAEEALAQEEAEELAEVQSLCHRDAEALISEMNWFAEEGVYVQDYSVYTTKDDYVKNSLNRYTYIAHFNVVDNLNRTNAFDLKIYTDTEYGIINYANMD